MKCVGDNSLFGVQWVIIQSNLLVMH